MSAVAVEGSGFSVPEYLSWDELQQLPDHIADEIELWDRKVIWNRRGPLAHQRFTRRICNAIEFNARRDMRDSTDDEQHCWDVEAETNVFFNADKSRFLTPDFLVRRCSPPDADTHAADVVLVGEVLSGSDTPKRRAWKRDRYADVGIPWYWEVELDASASQGVATVQAYELVVVSAAGLPVKPLRPAVYVLAGEWGPTDGDINISAPFDLHISWEELAF